MHCFCNFIVLCIFRIITPLLQLYGRSTKYNRCMYIWSIGSESWSLVSKFYQEGIRSMKVNH